MSDIQKYILKKISNTLHLFFNLSIKTDEIGYKLFWIIPFPISIINKKQYFFVGFILKYYGYFLKILNVTFCDFTTRENETKM